MPLLLAILLLVWLPFSFTFPVAVEVPLGWVAVGRGAVYLGQLTVDDFEYFYRTGHSAVWPQYVSDEFAGIPMRLLTVPLWLLAVLCLAWPVTSFVIARRRRRARGFEVEITAP